MKKQCILPVTLFIYAAFIFSATGQTIKPDSVNLKPLMFLRLSGLTFLSKTLSLGLEFKTSSHEALIVDGFYTLPGNSPRLNSQTGWGVQTDYHFYSADQADKNRWYVGMGVMYRRQSLDKIITPYLLSLSEGKNDRVSYGAHLKIGFELPLNNNGRSRFEFFTGVGFQHKSIRESISFFTKDGWDYVEGGIRPRLMFGAVLKL